MTPDPDGDRLDQKALALVNWIIERAVSGVPPLTRPDDLAAEYAASARYRTAADRVHALIRWEAAKNFATGFATGLGGLATLPFAVPAALGVSWVLQARLAGAIAVLHGHSLRSDRVRTLILLAIVGESAKDVVKAAGIVAGRRSTANAIRTVPGRMLVQLNRLIGMRLLAKAGRGGAVGLTKAVPIAGGLVGGGFDAATCVAVGKVADQLFAPIEVEVAPAAMRRKPARGEARKPEAAATRATARPAATAATPRMAAAKPRGAAARRRAAAAKPRGSASGSRKRAPRKAALGR
jgi:hypothetical protein